MSITIDNAFPVTPTVPSQRNESTENIAYWPYTPRNTDPSQPSTIAADEFIRMACGFESVVGAATGIFDGDLYVWLFLEEIEVSITRSLFEMQSVVQQLSQGTFELHVDALQGRSLVDALPKDFQLLYAR